MSDLTLKISILYALLFLSINCPSYILKARSFIGEIEKDSIYLFKFMTVILDAVILKEICLQLKVFAGNSFQLSFLIYNINNRHLYHFIYISLVCDESNIAFSHIKSLIDNAFAIVA